MLFRSLSSGYNQLPAGYNQLASGYNQLPAGYNQLAASYNQLGNNQLPLGSNYGTLRSKIGFQPVWYNNRYGNQLSNDLSLQGQNALALLRRSDLYDTSLTLSGPQLALNNYAYGRQSDLPLLDVDKVNYQIGRAHV